MYSLFATLLAAVASDPRLNGYGDGLTPRAAPSYDPETQTYTLGAPLSGSALTAAQALKTSWDARIKWLGNEALATKYGNVDPSGVTLAGVELESWERTRGVATAITTAITAALVVPSLGVKPSGSSEASPGASARTSPVPDVVSPAPAPSPAPESPVVLAVRSMLGNLSPEDRAALLASVTQKA